MERRSTLAAYASRWHEWLALAIAYSVIRLVLSFATEALATAPDAVLKLAGAGLMVLAGCSVALAIARRRVDPLVPLPLAVVGLILALIPDDPTQRPVVTAWCSDFVVDGCAAALMVVIAARAIAPERLSAPGSALAGGMALVRTCIGVAQALVLPGAIAVTLFVYIGPALVFQSYETETWFLDGASASVRAFARRSSGFLVSALAWWVSTIVFLAPTLIVYGLGTTVEHLMVVGHAPNRLVDAIGAFAWVWVSGLGTTVLTAMYLATQQIPTQAAPEPIRTLDPENPFAS